MTTDGPDGGDDVARGEPQSLTDPHRDIGGLQALVDVSVISGPVVPSARWPDTELANMRITSNAPA